ncbi:MAG: SIS domain-containing protein [Clostridia bacterium]|nr:SIS domain-containing protein [Clostridia bacterium]
MSMIDNYFRNMTELLEKTLASQKESLEKASQKIAESLKNGGMLYTFGTGHGHLLALEIFYRAGGMAKVCPILDERLMLHINAAESSGWERAEGLEDELLKKYPIQAGDVLISISNSGRNTVPVMLAKAAKERGAFVIALTSMQHTSSVTPRNKAGLRLFEAADLVLDNGGILGDAAMQMADGAYVGPTSTAVGASMLQAIACRVKEISLEEGWEAEYFKSSNVDGGDEYNQKLLDKYKALIPGLA